MTNSNRKYLFLFLCAYKAGPKWLIEAFETDFFCSLINLKFSFHADNILVFYTQLLIICFFLWFRIQRSVCKWSGSDTFSNFIWMWILIYIREQGIRIKSDAYRFGKENYLIRRRIHVRFHNAVISMADMQIHIRVGF